MSPEMFTGWGVRTLATSIAAYDPMSCHNGSVWPHDTAICVGGLARYGYAEEAGRMALALLDAASGFGYRLPELFAGLPPRRGRRPGAVPGRVQASVAPVELVRAMLGLEPDEDGLACTPAVPPRLLPLRLEDASCRGESYIIEVNPDGWSVARTPVGG